jgi:hypothetical protein
MTHFTRTQSALNSFKASFETTVQSRGGVIESEKAKPALLVYLSNHNCLNAKEKTFSVV